jgi:protoheme IX farnesyltransferase
MACAGSSLLNNYLDRDIDAIMERTRNRPLPRGRFASSKVLIIGLVLLILSLLIGLRLNYLVALLLLSGALVYVGLYTIWLKRRSSLNIVIGGLAGSCAVLGGWFSVTNQLSLTPLLIALVIFLWTPSHFWSFALVHRESYQKANVPMLPVVTGDKNTVNYIMLHSGLLLLVSLLLYFLSPLNELYLFASLVLGTIFLASSIRLRRQIRRERAWSNYKLSGIYLLGLFLAMALDVLLL